MWGLVVRLSLTLVCATLCAEPVQFGLDRVFSPPFSKLLRGKRIALVTNHTALDQDLRWSVDLFKEKQSTHGFKLIALLGPEHGLYGESWAGERIAHSTKGWQIPIYSLHGKTRRPTEAMLRGVNLIVFDIQDIGVRSYTYASTLAYVMEEAAKRKIPVLVLDRPNPLGGDLVDGPLVRKGFHSFVSYLDVPYCHGMTLAELARWFKHKKQPDCSLHLVPMKGWKRSMSFQESGRKWVPTSPQIPTEDSAFFYATTGLWSLLLGNISVGVGYTLPFQVVGAPWIDAFRFAKTLAKTPLPGVHFYPLHFKPFFGKFKGVPCGGVLLIITDSKKYKPFATGALLMGVLKGLYPKKFLEGLKQAEGGRAFAKKVFGGEEVFQICEEKPYPYWALRSFAKKQAKRFREERKPFLIPSYED